jgi:uncharacterized RmlC-like cupin family protein
MASSDPVRLVRPADRVEGDPTPGMVREQAIAEGELWAGLVRTGARMTSGWHHHCDYDTAIYIVGGALRMECGPGGTTVVDAAPGDFLHVPKGAVHRESNPTDAESQIVVVRAGHGPPTVNVDGPPPAGS